MRGRYNTPTATFDRALAVTPNDAVARVARGLAELDSNATVQPGQVAVQEVLANDPADGVKIVDRWFNIALCARDAFFSSRRRHTIFDCDWSSDVCSSD